MSFSRATRDDAGTELRAVPFARGQMRRAIRDDAGVIESDARAQYYVVEQLGEKRSFTPEGYLLCLDVPICRTGTMLYDSTELDVDGQKGVIRVERTEDEVFKPEHIFSYAGKPVLNDHPSVDVSPLTWRKVVMGVVMNPRRGTGLFADCIIADLMIMDPEAIADVIAGKREVSCGYDANYEETGHNSGFQKDLLGNHVALVDSGRCGTRCSIGDHSLCTKPSGDAEMKFQDNAAPSVKRRSIMDRLRAALKVKDEEGAEEALKELEKEPVEDSSEALHIHLPGGGDTPGGSARKMTDEDIEERFGSIEKAIKDGFEGLKKKPDENTEDEEMEEALAEEAPEGVTKDAAMKARDSVYLGDSWRDTAALAEILVPGISIGTYDAASTPKKTYDSICKLRRTTLDLAYTTPDGRDLIDSIHGKRMMLDAMTCPQVRTLFRSAGTAKKMRNNDKQRGVSSMTDAQIHGSGGGLGVRSKVKTPAELNALNAARYPRP